MSKLQEFLKINVDVASRTAKTPVSRRFRDDGEGVLLFEIKGVSASEYAAYQDFALKTDATGNHKFNAAAFNEKLVINHCLDPNFKDAESIKAAGVQTPEQFLNKTMLAGEIETLANEVLKLSGYGVNIEQLRKEAKNS